MMSIKEMHTFTVKCNRTLLFYAQELQFFRKYIADYTLRMTEMDKKDVIEAFSNRINHLLVEREHLNDAMVIEEKELLKRIENVNNIHIDETEKIHLQLKNEMKDFEGRCLNIKEGVYDFFIETSSS